MTSLPYRRIEVIWLCFGAVGSWHWQPPLSLHCYCCSPVPTQRPGKFFFSQTEIPKCLTNHSGASRDHGRDSGLVGGNAVSRLLETCKSPGRRGRTQQSGWRVLNEHQHRAGIGCRGAWDSFLFEKRYQENLKLHLDGRKPMRSSFINRTLEFGKCSLWPFCSSSSTSATTTSAPFFFPRNERILEVQKRNSLLLAAIVGIMLVLAKQLQHWNKKDFTAPRSARSGFFMVTTWLPNFCEAMLWEASAWETPPSVATWKHPLDSPIPQKTMDAEQLDCQVLRPLSCNVFGLWWSISSKLSNFWRGSNTIPFLFGYGAARRGSHGIPLGFWELNWVGMCVIAHM